MSAKKSHYLDALPSISHDSPRLAGELIRSHIAADELAKLDAIFSAAMAAGGGAELDFVREEGVSFNPRPARIALILLEEEGSSGWLALAAGMAVAAGDPAAFPAEIRDLWTGDLAPLVNGASASARKIAAAHLLDRLRHLHQGEKQGRAIAWEDFLSLAKKYSEDVAGFAPVISNYLRAWYERNEVRRRTGS